MDWAVEQVMTTDVACVGPDAGFKEVLAVLRSRCVTAVPVVEDRVVLGVVSEADLMARIEHGGLELAEHPILGAARRGAVKVRAQTARDLMTSPAITIAAGATISEAARVMHQHRVKRLPVVDGRRRLVGIVSRADLLKVFLRTDQAIKDEIEQDLKTILWLEPGTVRVTVVGSVVHLEGLVETRSLARMVARLAWSVAGVVAVEDGLHHRFDDSAHRTETPPLALQLSARERRL